MTVPPIPIGSLLPAARFSNRTIFFVIPLEIPAIGMVFVRIPIVIVLVAAVVDRKSTRLNSSHQIISYAVFCLKKKKKHCTTTHHRILPSHLPPHRHTP